MSDKTIDQIVDEHYTSGKYIQVGDLKTFALDYGEGTPVLCIHGVPTSSYLYRKVAKSLQIKGYRAIAIDLPGLGFTDRPEDFDYSFDNLSKFMAEATEALQFEKFHLLVHDVGGPIGFALAARHKDKILSLTILNTWIDVTKFKKPLPMRPFEIPVLGEAQLSMLNHLTWPVMMKTLGLEDSEVISKEEINSYVDILKREDGGKAFLKIMRSFDDSEEFRDLCYKAVQDVPYPVQAIWGEEDPGLKYERYGEEIKEVAGLQTVYKLKARHFLQEEKWEEIAMKIDEMINSDVEK